MSRQSRCVVLHSFGACTAGESFRAASFPASVMWGLCQKTSVLQCKDFSLWLRKFVPVRNTFPWVRDCPFTKLLSLLESLLDTLPSYTLIVDALDECTEDVQVLFRYIVNLG